MKLKFSNAIFDVEELLMGKINQKKFSKREKYVLNFIKRWHSDEYSFLFSTSGSTGEPKNVQLSRKQLTYSALQTIEYFFGKNQPDSLLLCLDPTFIGGSQVISRALITNANLLIMSPSSNPIVHLNESIDLTSFVPLQLETILKESPEKLKLLKNVLIGGAELKPILINQLINIKPTKFYQTYGMTETASHVAIKPIETDVYQPLGDLELKVDDRNCLRMKGAITNHRWIQTNDIVSLVDDGFIWLGRADWVINSGGIKISPEKLENKIQKHFLQETVAISSKIDEKLGERLVLVSSKPLLDQIKIKSILTKFELPKEEIIIPNWPKNKGGKLDRRKIQNWVRSH